MFILPTCFSSRRRVCVVQLLFLFFLSFFLSSHTTKIPSFFPPYKIEIEIRSRLCATTTRKERRRRRRMDFSSSSPPVALSAVFIVNLRGDVLIERQYRSDVTRQNINAFKTDILNGHRKSVKRMALSSSKTTKGYNNNNNNAVDVQSLPPVRVVGRVKFMFIRVANVYVCAATKLNVNVSMCFAFLKSAIGTFQVRKEWCRRRTRKRERKKMTFFSHSARTLKGSKRRFYVYDASREELYAASVLFFPRDILSRVFVDVSLRRRRAVKKTDAPRSLFSFSHTVVLWQSERKQHPREFCVNLRTVR